MATDDKLVKGLEAIFNHLEKKGLVTAAMVEKKESIINDLAETLTKSGKFEANDLKDPMVQMRLMGSMVCKGLGLTTLDKYFTNSLEKNPKDKTNELDNVLLIVFSALKVLQSDKNASLEPKSLAEKMIEQAKKLVMGARKGNKDDPQQQKIDAALDDFKDPLAESLRILDGGKDPRNIDAIPSVVLCISAGEQFGITIKEAPHPGAGSFLNDLVSYNPEKPDYTGGEANILISGIANGISDLTELEYSMSKAIPGAPKPHAPGTSTAL